MIDTTFREFLVKLGQEIRPCRSTEGLVDERLHLHVQSETVDRICSYCKYARVVDWVFVNVVLIYRQNYKERYNKSHL